MTDKLTVEEAARLMGYKPRTVQRLAGTGAIRAEKFSGVWMIHRDSAEAFQPERKPGRPKKVAKTS